jgi:hypothetical protein
MPSKRYLGASRREATRPSSGLYLRGYERLRNFVTVFERQTVEVARRHMKDLAHAYAREVRRIVRTQVYSWKPLSKRYLEWKRSHSVVRRRHRRRFIGIYRTPSANRLRNLGADVKPLSEKIYIATGDFLRNIRARERKVQGRVVWVVGPSSGTHAPSGLTYRELARIHEFGSRAAGVPPRPLWRPSWSAFSRSQPRRVLRTVAKEALDEARKRT